MNAGTLFLHNIIFTIFDTAADSSNSFTITNLVMEELESEVISGLDYETMLYKTVFFAYERKKNYSTLFILD